MLGLNLGSIQNASLAAETAARQSVRVFVQETEISVASRKTEWAIHVALLNFGIDQPLSIERRCIPSPCLSPGSAVTVRVGVLAPVFGTALFPILSGEGIPVYAEATAIVSPYGGAP